MLVAGAFLISEAVSGMSPKPVDLGLDMKHMNISKALEKHTPHITTQGERD